MQFFVKPLKFLSFTICLLIIVGVGLVMGSNSAAFIDLSVPGLSFGSRALFLVLGVFAAAGFLLCFFLSVSGRFRDRLLIKKLEKELALYQEKYGADNLDQ